MDHFTESGSGSISVTPVTAPTPTLLTVTVKPSGAAPSTGLASAVFETVMSAPLETLPTMKSESKAVCDVDVRVVMMNELKSGRFASVALNTSFRSRPTSKNSCAIGPVEPVESMKVQGTEMVPVLMALISCAEVRVIGERGDAPPIHL